MGNAIWLFLALPQWYFSAIFRPFAEGLFTAIPSLGIVCLAIGIILGVIGRKPSLLIFLFLPAMSQALVAAAGLMRGTLRYEAYEPILWAFLLLQVTVAGYLVYRLKNARPAAAALGIFTISYAFFAWFVAAMAFGDTWV